jgi:hypothetical protein
MPIFFLPGFDDPDVAEQHYAAIKKFAEKQTGWRVSDRRVFRIEYVHNGEDMYAQVGKAHPYGHPVSWEYAPDIEDPSAGELVVAILESKGGVYLVCTQNRGVNRGEPILAGQPHTIADFEEALEEPGGAF